MLSIYSEKRECEDIPVNINGVYTIHPDGGDRAVLVYCILGQTKKWTVSIWLKSEHLKCTAN